MPGLHATLVRRTLSVVSSGCEGRLANSVLLDIAGRKVMGLEPGANDVRALAPGVYFVRAVEARAHVLATHKVVITR